ncbi:hypothetical protein HPB47_002042 [Ixodes persulcatus]|uniref:Uncharacterized protein n=1 Tax=Ixodes persulcatus TaxID=34615 RepID=A0AC60PMD3_IXOPE|nr:hypothetical protein HPB47_002042 [Ixodes persulcatus]
MSSRNNFRSFEGTDSLCKHISSDAAAPHMNEVSVKKAPQLRMRAASFVRIVQGLVAYYGALSGCLAGYGNGLRAGEEEADGTLEKRGKLSLPWLHPVSSARAVLHPAGPGSGETKRPPKLPEKRRAIIERSDRFQGNVDEPRAPGRFLGLSQNRNDHLCMAVSGGLSSAGPGPF